MPDDAEKRAEDDPNFKITVIEAVLPENGAHKYLAVTEDQTFDQGKSVLVSEGQFSQSPFINFRWLKAPGEIYGRSPVMKALPDIKTANKVVELTLKNASIAVTGIWQADDDGVLNPASIKLAPGTIIPKAVGSAGLTPLNSPGRFDISELVLNDLRSQIRQALLVGRLGQPDSPQMTATEVLKRSSEIARLLGATYGRLQSELLTPLVTRALSILSHRGVIPEITIDGRLVDLEYKSPLAREQIRQDAQNTLLWLDTIKGMGPEAESVIDKEKLVRWLARTFGVPAEIIQTHSQLAPSDALQLDGSEQELGLEGGMELAKSSIEDLSGGGIEETLAQFLSGVLPVEEQNA